MKNAELILDIQDNYDNANQKDIVENVKTALYVGEHSGKSKNIYKELPNITGKSHFTVNGWFNSSSKKKIPLVNICAIMDYLGYSVYTIFRKTDEISNVILFNKVNDEMLSVHGKDCEKVFLKAFNMQYETDKDIVLNNIEKYYGSAKDMEKHHLDDRLKRITEICECTKDTYHAWFNRSRKNVKIPLLSLCKIAIDAGTDIFDLFKKED